MKPEFWRGKRVLVTGHTGFKGSWLSLWLHDMGANVVGCALAPPPEKNLYTAAKIGGLIESHYLDIRNADALAELVAKAMPEIVFHLAAQPLVLASYKDPIETYETNVLGTLHVLEAIRSAASVRAAVMVTSDKCYENREWERPYRETDRLGGHDPYSSSKACVEILVASYRKSYFSSAIENAENTLIATARAGNVVGGGDWAENRLLPDLMRAIEKGTDIVLRSPDSVRPWQHVLESLSGYLLLAQRLGGGEEGFDRAWNFGPDEADVRSVRWIAEHVAMLSGTPCAVMTDSALRPHESTILKLDSGEATTQLGWTPRWDIEKTVERVVQWYSDERSGEDPQTLCRQHILDYVNTTTE